MSKQNKTAAYEQYNYPIIAREEIAHQLAEDIRKRLWLWSYGKKATEDNASIPTGTYGTDETGWWGISGSFRGIGNNSPFPDESESGLSSVDNHGPGKFSIWFNEAWGNGIGDAGANDYNIKGATIDYTTSSGHEIWVENVQLSTEESIEGNLLVGCPLEITGGDSGVSEINGYWRITAARTITESGTEYVLLTLKDFHEENSLVLLNDYGFLGAYSNGGEVECDFGGDWYAFCPMDSGLSAVEFMSDVDIQHVHIGNVRGDDDKRPPDGGKFSADYNRYWRRTANPFRYHHYDKNAHRWLCNYDQHDGGDYYSVIESWRFLPIFTDPKEQVPPIWYKDTERTAWQIAGNKVEIQAEQLTDAAAMGAAQGSSAEQKASSDIVTNAKTDFTVTWNAVSETFITAAAEFNGVVHPIPSMGSGFNNQRPEWKETKIDTTCIWPWVEINLRRTGFVLEVNNTYKTNWLEKNKDVIDAVTLSGDPAGTTYGDKWLNGSWNLDGYRPEFNNTQPSWAYLYDELWGENGSALEKILSDLGDYDWFYDTDNVFIPYDIMKGWKEIETGEEYNSDDPPATGTEAAANWEFPLPTGTWRKVPKYTLGYMDGNGNDNPNVTGFMRDYEKGAPTSDDFEVKGASEIWPWPGIYIHPETNYTSSDFGNYTTNLLDRHGPLQVHDSVHYWEKTILILNAIIDVIESVEYADAELGTSLGWFIHSENYVYGDDDPVLADIYERADDSMLAVMDGSNPIDDSGDWISPPVVNVLQRRRHFYKVGPATPNWEGYHPSIPSQNRDSDLALRCFEFPPVDMYDSMIFWIKVGFRDGADFVDEAKSYLAEIRGIGNQVITQDDDEDTYYWIEFKDLFTDTGNNVLWAKFYLVNVHPNLFLNVAETYARFEIYARMSLHNYSTVGALAKYDWNKISDAVFERDLTYALLKPEDPTTDTDPPVHAPAEFFLTPVLYDANRPTRDLIGESQTHDDYVPEWHNS